MPKWVLLLHDPIWGFPLLWCQLLFPCGVLIYFLPNGSHIFNSTGDVYPFRISSPEVTINMEGISCDNAEDAVFSNIPCLQSSCHIFCLPKCGNQSVCKFDVCLLPSPPHWVLSCGLLLGRSISSWSYKMGSTKIFVKIFSWVCDLQCYNLFSTYCRVAFPVDWSRWSWILFTHL